MRTLYIEYERDRSVGLDHGCARVTHCVTVRRRNFSHYCRPLRQYDVSLTCTEHREALTARGQHTAYTNKRLQCKDEVHISPLNKQGGFVTSQQQMGGLKRFPLSSVISAPVVQTLRSATVSQTDTHTHTHTHTFLDCGSDVESKIMKKKSKANFFKQRGLGLSVQNMFQC